MERQITIQFRYEVADEDQLRSSLVMDMHDADSNPVLIDTVELERAIPAAWMKLAVKELYPHTLAAGIKLNGATVVGMS